MTEVNAVPATTLGIIDQESDVVAPTYSPLPVVITAGEGAWVTDVEGRKFLDALSGYSAVNFGHLNPDLVAVAKEQLDQLTMVSRAFHNDKLGPFCKALADLAGASMVLPMNTGAEAVETAIKAARKWGYEVKGVPADSAEIIVMSSNFHGRTTTIISFSDDPDSRDGFGPYPPGFIKVPFGDLQAIKRAATSNTVGVLVEPIQGEAGVVIPPDDFLPGLREFCTDNDILLIADEIQSGLGRTGTTFACELYGVKPDLMTLGKALGGGVVPVSAVVGRTDVLGLLTPGTHGSTFGGNPLAAAVGLEVVKMVRSGVYQKNAQERGAELGACLGKLQEDYPEQIIRVSQVGLWVGIEFDPDFVSGREISKTLLEHGVLTKEAHDSVVRISPPLIVTSDDVRLLCSAIREVVADRVQASV